MIGIEVTVLILLHIFFLWHVFVEILWHFICDSRASTTFCYHRFRSYDDKLISRY